MLTVRELSLSYGGPALFDRAQFTIQRGERIALIGRNGEGKSSLMKVVAGLAQADRAEFERNARLRISYLPQEVPDSLPGDVEAVIRSGLATDANAEPMEDWQSERLVEKWIHAIRIPGDQAFDALSGGMKRRVILGRALVGEPDLLLLDEPTNHLDFESIRWLEDLVRGLPIAVLFVTHDRAFLRAVATRILELDRGKLTSFDCGYDTYLERKAALLDGESSENAVFDKKLSQEEVWIRRGVKARRTRNEGRVRALEQLRRERSQRRELRDDPSFSLQEGALSGRKVITVEDMSYGWDGCPIVTGFSTTIWRGDKIGLIGSNGSGKTTLLRLLLGDLQPQSGTVAPGTNLEIAYFDQHREQLDPEMTLKQVVAGDEDHVNVGGEKRHIYTYLQDFLFPPAQARGRVSALSGGERNRLLLAKIFTTSANLLVMDEPTNDLDLETLELLEDLLFDYQGTLLLVSHDRQFLNRVVTQTLSLEGNGKVRETVGGYDEYQRDLDRERAKQKNSPTPIAAAPDPQKLKGARPEKTRYRTNKEQAELDAIPGKLEILEAKQTELATTLGSPEVVSNPGKLRIISQELEVVEQAMHKMMEQWEALEAIPPNPKKG